MVGKRTYLHTIGHYNNAMYLELYPKNTTDHQVLHLDCDTNCSRQIVIHRGSFRQHIFYCQQD